MMNGSDNHILVDENLEESLRLERYSTKLCKNTEIRFCKRHDELFASWKEKLLLLKDLNPKRSINVLQDIVLSSKIKFLKDPLKWLAYGIVSSKIILENVL